MTQRCRTPNCVRILGHSGCCTSAPSARTLDWDQDPRPYVDKRAEILDALDFETPWWARILLDDEP